jgi:hypothetical protein
LLLQPFVEPNVWIIVFPQVQQRDPNHEQHCDDVEERNERNQQNHNYDKNYMFQKNFFIIIIPAAPTNI